MQGICVLPVGRRVFVPPYVRKDMYIILFLKIIFSSLLLARPCGLKLLLERHGIKVGGSQAMNTT